MATGFPIIFGSGKVWTPAQISTASWWDAADASTITLNGSTVSQWADKSGNGRHMVQATAALQPSYGITSFSLPSINCADQFLTSAAISASASDWSVFGMLKQTETAPTVNDSLFSTAAGGSGSVQFARGASGLSLSWTSDGGVAGSGAIDSNTAVYRLLSLQTTTAGFGTFLNGTQVIGSAVTLRTGATLGYAVGRNRLGGLYLQSDHAEWIVLSSAPTTEVRQQIEGYLAWKWGRQGLLPATHPYKNSPPR